jgi:hypothetical protein
MRLRFLGTGAALGVPGFLCGCKTHLSVEQAVVSLAVFASTVLLRCISYLQRRWIRTHRPEALTRAIHGVV